MASRKILIVNLKDDACVFFFFWYNQGYPERWPRLIPFRIGWQVFPKQPAVDEERGRTPDLMGMMHVFNKINYELDVPINIKMNY